MEDVFTIYITLMPWYRGLMPITCAICKTVFPFQVRIRGKLRNLCCRKYCLKCSPFGSRNTRDPRDRKKGPIVCLGCKRVYRYKKSSGHSWKMCNSCMVNKRRPGMKLRAIDSMGGSCLICGYKKCSRSLQFHHLDPRKKSFGIGANTTRSWKSIRRELRKCVLVCSNCHGEIHDGLIDLRQYVNGRRVGR